MTLNLTDYDKNVKGNQSGINIKSKKIMFIDKDNWGNFSIQDLSERELRLLHEALRVYAQSQLGRIHPTDNIMIMRFDSEYIAICLQGKNSKNGLI